jgi:osmotically-inducible protein OsmY
MRIRLEVGFAAPRLAPSALATTIQTRLARLAVDHSLGRPEVAVEGDTVVLRGVAESESQRQVLANLIALEPGVRAVRNEMVVAVAPATPAAAPTAQALPPAN